MLEGIVGVTTDVIGILLFGHDLGAIEWRHPGSTVRRPARSSEDNGSAFSSTHTTVFVHTPARRRSLQLITLLNPVLVEIIITGRVAPWRGVLPFLFPARREANRNIGEIKKILAQLVSDARARLAKGELSKDTIIHGLLTMRHPKTGDPLSEDELLAETLMWLVAGMDSTSMQVSWCLYVLSQHPDAERKLLAEIDGVLGPPPPAGASPERVLSFDDMASMPFLAAVLRETMRRAHAARSLLFRDSSAFQTD